MSCFLIMTLLLSFSHIFWVNCLSEFGPVNGKVNSPIPGGGARSFTFKELAAATRNFREVNLLGEGGFGRVYKGRLDSGQVRSLSPSLFLMPSFYRETLFL